MQMLQISDVRFSLDNVTTNIWERTCKKSSMFFFYTASAVKLAQSVRWLLRRVSVICTATEWNYCWKNKSRLSPQTLVVCPRESFHNPNHSPNRLQALASIHQPRQLQPTPISHFQKRNKTWGQLLVTESVWTVVCGHIRTVTIALILMSSNETLSVHNSLSFSRWLRWLSVAISVSADNLLRTHLQRDTVIAFTIICLGKAGQLNGVDFPWTKSRDPTNVTEWSQNLSSWWMSVFSIELTRKERTCL